MSSAMPYGLGMDFGTSGARAIVIDPQGQVVAIAHQPYDLANTPPVDLTAVWRQALWQLLSDLDLSVREQIQAVAIDGTSATLIFCDPEGEPIAAPLLYNDPCGQTVLPELAAIVPANQLVLSATSSLAKALWWQRQNRVPPYLKMQQVMLLHQADWLAAQLHGQVGLTDYHNALKLGYDIDLLQYPDWMDRVPLQIGLPNVVPPGEPIAPVLPEISDSFGLPATCQVCAGTTDSIAAFLASGASEPGDAVTSLGSTLVLKLLSEMRVDHVPSGVYSHRLGDRWLVGGASNTGGAVLRQFFSDRDLHRLSSQLQPDRPTGLDYYPLIKPGERFPINDPDYLPRLEPRPEAAIVFLQGLLEGMANIEAQGYELLQQLGASPLRRVLTAGGGAQNAAWQAIRAQRLGVPVQVAPCTEAAYGSARLALGMI